MFLDQNLVRQLREQVADLLAQQRQDDAANGIPPMSGEDERRFARALISRVLDQHARAEISAGRSPLAAQDEDDVAQGNHAALFGVGRLQPLLEDPEVENIDINGYDNAFIQYADGREERGAPVADSDDELVELVQILGSCSGLVSRPFGSANPQLDRRLPDGSRLSAIMDVCARPALSLRRARLDRVGLEDLVRLGTLSPRLAAFCSAAVRARKNIMIAGATNAGKTTFLRALANEIPPSERLITVERALELGLGEFPSCDIVLPDFSEPLVRVEVGAKVRVSAIGKAGQLDAPARPVREHKLPGPLVLRTRTGTSSALAERSKELRRERRRQRKLDKQHVKENKRRQKLGEKPVVLPQAHVEQDPDAGRKLVELDRRPLVGRTDWESETILALGQSQMTIGPVPPADAVVVSGSQASTLDFNRPPRLARPQRHAKFTLPREPQRPRKQPFSLIMLLGPLVMGTSMYMLTGRLLTLMFTFLSPIMMIANRFASRSSSHKQYRNEVVKYDETKRLVEAAAFKSLLEEHQLRRADHPDPAEVMLRATGPRAALWERRPYDRDWLQLRVGTADQRSEIELGLPDRATYEEPLRWTAPDVPVTLPLRHLGVAGVCGAKRHVTASWLACQCAVLHSPAEVELMVLIDPEQSEDAARNWEWACWLPHLRMPEGPGSRLRAALDEDTVARQVNGLVQLIEERTEAKTPPSNGMVVVLDGARALRRVPGMIQALRQGGKVGVTFICLDDDREALPEECRAVVDAAEPWASVSITDAEKIEQVTLDLPEPLWFERIGRSLAPYRDAAAKGAEGTIPHSSRFLDIVNMPEPSAAEVLRRWQGGTATTKAVIGEDGEGLFAVDVRADGPHALVAGTTGSGKSELLQTLIASLCAGNTPEAMTFVLVDYKGGAAFKDCARLPHTVGMVTDLDGHLTSRALESLGAELRRREHMLAAADAKDIEDYTAALQPGDEPMPRLMLIIDEFAALVAELPEFVTGLVDIARRGRSLGVHLVLATQRPAGVVSAEIKSNTNLRIALRVTDENDSQDVVESNASAHIPPSIPGRAHARLGHGRLLQFQASRVGGRPRGAVRIQGPRVERFSLAGLSRPAPQGPSVEEDVSIPTDLASLVDAMLEARASTGLPEPHRPWLEPLPTLVTLDALEHWGQEDPREAPEASHTDITATGFLPPVVIGLEDLPAELLYNSSCSKDAAPMVIQGVTAYAAFQAYSHAARNPGDDLAEIGKWYDRAADVLTLMEKIDTDNTAAEQRHNGALAATQALSVVPVVGAGFALTNAGLTAVGPPTNHNALYDSGHSGSAESLRAAYMNNVIAAGLVAPPEGASFYDETNGTISIRNDGCTQGFQLLDGQFEGAE
ncbi:ATPase, T2SS/T4P/T4SS family [Actinomyces trachealis]|uniref:ATPase, T2SS/T4P/T4SS family n=1 Tax=Actinomyces trachealis TaxID=2763540 RepID=UPI001F333A06|nr:ATPase, T2SS/T4P/T4SS family [Actinomyces trachealis]